jgi:hypothetical protein
MAWFLTSSETVWSVHGEHNCQMVPEIAQAAADPRYGFLPRRPLSQGVDVGRGQATGKNDHPVLREQDANRDVGP